jgi:hypothetical protein
MKEGSVFLVLIFPRPWPPLDEVEMFARDQDDSRIRLLADNKGRFCFQIHSYQGAKEHWFQPALFEGSGRAILSICWSGEAASLRLNAQDILLDADAQGEPVLLRTKTDPIPPNDLIIGEINLNTAQYEAESFFLATIMDIDHKVREGSRYSLIRAAGLLRQLFIDSTPLVHVVNRTHRQKILFETLDYNLKLKLPLAPEAYAQDLDGSLFPGAKLITSDLDNFLKVPCFEMSGVTATVRDLIRACANAKGGVHLGATRTVEEDLVMDWDRTFRLLGAEPSLRTIAGVCRVALRGLKPLVESIVSSASQPAD